MKAIEMNAKPLCIYHAGCTDGFASAWAVRKFFGDQARTVARSAGIECTALDLYPVDFHPGIYGEAPPDVTGRNVILVDFSYKRDILLTMIEQAQSMLILDHHKSAQEELADLPAKARTVFDMARSGAMITWDHFFTGQSAPLLFDFVQDRDLWRFKFPGTREVMAAVFSYPMEFLVWDELIYATSVQQLIQEGRALVRKNAADVAELIKNATRPASYRGFPIQVANVPWMFASDVAGELAKGHPFGATYYDDATGRRWSLRSTQYGADVALIAQAFGGGGHKNAAGFRMTREEAIAFDVNGGFR